MPSTGNTNNTVNREEDFIEAARNWSGSPLDEPPWYYANKRALFDELKAARRYVTHGIVTSDKGHISVMSLEHGQAYLNGTLTVGTIDAPFRTATLPALTPVAPPAPAAMLGGPPPPPPLPPFLPTRLSDLGPDADRLRINPETCGEMAEKVIRHFTDRISNQLLRRRTVESNANDGAAFITAMELKMATIARICQEHGGERAQGAARRASRWWSYCQ